MDDYKADGNRQGSTQPVAAARPGNSQEGERTITQAQTRRGDMGPHSLDDVGRNENCGSPSDPNGAAETERNSEPEFRPNPRKKITGGGFRAPFSGPENGTKKRSPTISDF